MKEFPEGIKFKYSWRSYQQRVLEELQDHLSDKHLHVIAPPGSGKTVLGLEVALRINKPTLVLAPTIAIRNQWIQRFCELFLQCESIPEWISSDIKNPKFFTAATYQALHASVLTHETREENESADEENETNNGDSEVNHLREIIHLLREQELGTLIVDEAHHLKNEWWKSLNTLKKALKPVIVGLTATPPYDVTQTEWKRYLDFNGAVDAEISVPELVIENDLCPHQDYILISEPTIDEHRIIKEQKGKVQNLFEELKRDEILISAQLNHPAFKSPKENLEWIYDNLESYSSILVFLNEAGKLITDIHLEVIGDKRFKIPKLSYEWIEILLSFYLFSGKESFPGYEEHKEKLINKLSRNGVLEKRTICFRHIKRINKLLTSNLNKLKSIDQIVDIEHNTLKDDLRMLILTDYIRKEFLVGSTENSLELNKIGVLPIFEQLRRTNNRKLKIGVLSGSVVIIPISALKAFDKASQQLNCSKTEYSPLPFDSQYLTITPTEEQKHNIVRLVTAIFEQGEIQVLAGTKSLLGEGWDAPVINSLILASCVGSFVLSNQMRGRAIRTNRNNPDKTGNIWHLVCIDNSEKSGGDDIELLKRRFKGFVGISARDGVTIENGVGRLDLPEKFSSKEEIENFNLKMIRLAGERDLLKEKWNEGLRNGRILVEEIKVPFPEEKNYKKIKSFYYNRTIAYLLTFLGGSVAAYLSKLLEAYLKSGRTFRSLEDIFQFFMYAAMAILIFLGGLLLKTFRIFLKYRDITKDFHRIAETLLDSLIQIRAIRTVRSRLELHSSVDDQGTIYCHLKGGTTYEKSLFIKSLHEIAGPIDSPRYLIIRKGLFLKIISQKDYHSVPELIGQNKKNAEFFADRWRMLVGASKLIYTRTIEGRKILLRSRINSLASEFEDKTERINKWR